MKINTWKISQSNNHMQTYTITNRNPLLKPILENMLKWIYNKLVIFCVACIHVKTIEIIYVSKFNQGIRQPRVFGPIRSPYTLGRSQYKITNFGDTLFYDWLQLRVADPIVMSVKCPCKCKHGSMLSLQSKHRHVIFGEHSVFLISCMSVNLSN